jgi:hypothetical protein
MCLSTVESCFSNHVPSSRIVRDDEMALVSVMDEVTVEWYKTLLLHVFENRTSTTNSPWQHAGSLRAATRMSRTSLACKSAAPSEHCHEDELGRCKNHENRRPQTRKAIRNEPEIGRQEAWPKIVAAWRAASRQRWPRSPR